MSATVTLTQTEPVKAVPNGTSHVNGKVEEEPYKYSHLMPVWSTTKYPPLEPFVHDDPGMSPSPSIVVELIPKSRYACLEASKPTRVPRQGYRDRVDAYVWK